MLGLWFTILIMAAFLTGPPAPAAALSISTSGPLSVDIPETEKTLNKRTTIDTESAMGFSDTGSEWNKEISSVPDRKEEMEIRNYTSDTTTPKEGEDLSNAPNKDKETGAAKYLGDMLAKQIGNDSVNVAELSGSADVSTDELSGESITSPALRPIRERECLPGFVCVVSVCVLGTVYCVNLAVLTVEHIVKYVMFVATVADGSP